MPGDAVSPQLRPLPPYMFCAKWGMCKCRKADKGCRCGGKRCKNNGNIIDPDGGRWCIECCPKVGEAERRPPPPLPFADCPAYTVCDYPPGLVTPEDAVEPTPATHAIWTALKVSKTLLDAIEGV